MIVKSVVFRFSLVSTKGLKGSFDYVSPPNPKGEILDIPASFSLTGIPVFRYGLSAAFSPGLKSICVRAKGL